MGDLGQITQHGQRVGPFGILTAELGQCSCSIATQDHVHQVQHPAPVGQPQHGTDLIGAGFSGSVTDRLIQQRGRIARGPFSGAGDQGQRIVSDLHTLAGCDFAQQADHILGFDPAQVKTLAARQNGDRHLPNLGGGEDELHMFGRFFEGFEQRVECAGREHVNFVDDVNLIAGRGRAIADAVDDLADIVHTCAAGGVHLHHIDMAPFHDGFAMFADTTGFGGRAAVAIRPDTVHAFCDNPRGGGFTGAADAGHDKGLCDSVRLERVFQGAYHGILTNQIGKGFRAIFAGQNLIGGAGCVGHVCLRGFVSGSQRRGPRCPRPPQEGDFHFGMSGSAVKIIAAVFKDQFLFGDVCGGFMSQLVIYALQVGGGTLALSPLPGRGGAYGADLDLVADWRPGLVLSMTTEIEMIQDGARNFGADIQARASRWIHLPIEDFGTPPAEVLDLWPRVSATVRQALSGGGRILVHCRGGCGRSGMVVLRLMVECGERPEEALKRLRILRPCAVETDAQMAWALQPARVQAV
ncbi:Dual specificity phosphatase, catalytic domain protein [Rhodobacteraceae bacterium KLH11]|nr:Dual specificity phosphatase, catalytic domain protein [Rhodobacteraceae bacterium KLH11]